MPIPISLPMILDEHTTDVLADVHTAVPGTIQSWDAASQTATVQPMIRKPLRSVDGVQVYETPPVIQNVPCGVMRGGGFLVSVPFSAGDPVWLMFSEQSYSEYLSTGQVSNPKDIRRHGTGYPFAIPGPSHQTLSSVSSNSLVIGIDGGQEQISVSSGLIQAGASGADNLPTKADYQALILALQTFSSGLTMFNLAAQAATFNASLSVPAPTGAAPNFTTLFKAK